MTRICDGPGVTIEESLRPRPGFIEATCPDCGERKYLRVQGPVA